MKSLLRSIYPDLIAIFGFVILSFAYFSPVLDGRKLPQHDMQQATGMSRELTVYNQQTGKDAMWTNSMFSGMPAYQIRGGKLHNIFHSLQPVLRLNLPYTTAGILFVYLIGFYFLLRTLKLSHLIAFAGAVAFGFSSYNFALIIAGHVTQAYAIGYMAPVLAGIILIYSGRWIAGGLITLIATGIEISANHYQITYYLFLIIGLFVLIRFIYAIRNRELKSFLIASAITIVAMLISFAPNTTTIWTTYEISKYSTRGKSDLTDKTGDQTKGLPRSYILDDYSYGIPETMTLMIPNFLGGPSVGPLSQNSRVFSLLRQNGYSETQARRAIRQMPLYWGGQRFTAGPVYLGSIACFLFILSLFLLKGPFKWWLAMAALLSLILAWGKNISFISNLLIDYFPAYNKFRTVSMALVIASVAVPLAGILGFKKLADRETDSKHLLKSLFNSYYIAGGLALFFAILGGAFFSFSSKSDAGMPAPLIEALQSDRASLLRVDAIRSFIFITLAAGLIWLYLKDKIKLLYLSGGLIFLVLIDQWSVDKRYLNNDHFVTNRQAKEQFTLTDVDRQILQDTTYYRVMNLTTLTFSDAITSYFHKSVGGYHGAKLKRYQDLIERHLGRNNLRVINMLNTKYVIVPLNEKGGQEVRTNPGALGNAWFVDSLRWVDNADQEIAALDNFNPSTTAIIDKKFAGIIGNFLLVKDTSARISLTHYAPDELKYASSAQKEQLAVFSEIYYPTGWQVTIDGKPVEIARVNYVLRAMVVPSGNHTIEFKFAPRSFLTGQKISIASSALVVILVFAGIAWGVLKMKKTNL